MASSSLWPTSAAPAGALPLSDGSAVGIIGGGPAGSFFAHFLIDFAERAGLDLHVDIYEPRDFEAPAPQGCNMCGGIVSESLVQTLASEGINLPSTIVQRGLDSYVLHMDIGSLRIATPLDEKRIASVHRGGGPRDVTNRKWGSFDGYLQGLAARRGARVVAARVDQIAWEDGRPSVRSRGGEAKAYDLLAVAVGVNSGTLKLFQELPLKFEPPRTVKTFIREYKLGEEQIDRYLGSSMHVFLLNYPGLEFAAIIPKGDYVTLCLLGDELDNKLLDRFLSAPEVRRVMPPDWRGDRCNCQCAPRMNIRGAPRPFGDRVVFIGDCGVTRLYKDGIGGAYRVAKAAARTAVFHGVAAQDFERDFWPTCRRLDRDNAVGRLIFFVTRLIQTRHFARRAVWRMASREQRRPGGRRRMSLVLWDTFTGSAPYREILLRTFHPAFWTRFAWDNLVSMIARTRLPRGERTQAPPAPGDEGGSREEGTEPTAA